MPGVHGAAARRMTAEAGLLGCSAARSAALLRALCWRATGETPARRSSSARSGVSAWLELGLGLRLRLGLRLGLGLGLGLGFG